MLDLLARVLLAAVFVAAVAGKVRSRQEFAGFRDSVAALAPRWLPVGPVAVAVVAGEAATVVLLAVPLTGLAGYTLATVLLAVFCLGIVRMLHSGQSVHCRCFGAGGGVLGPKHLVRNALLIAVAVAVAGALGGDVTPPAPEEPLTLLTVAVVLLAAVVVLHVLFTVGLVARVRELRENAGAPARDPGMPKPGSVIRPFSVTDTEGVPFTEADLDGPVQVCFFSVGCGPCRTLSDDLVANPPTARFVSIVDGEPADPDGTARLVAKLSVLGRVAVIGADDPVLSAFEVVAFPTLLHTHSGVVTASGFRLSQFADVPDMRRPVA